MCGGLSYKHASYSNIYTGALAVNIAELTVK
jgi:hypothetical protein